MTRVRSVASVLLLLVGAFCFSSLSASPVPEYQDVGDVRALTAGLESEYHELRVTVGLVVAASDGTTVVEGWALDALILTPTPLLGLTWETLPPPSMVVVDLMGVPSSVAITCGTSILGTAIEPPKCWHPLALGLAETVGVFEDLCPTCGALGSDPRNPDRKAQVFPWARIGYEDEYQPGWGNQVPFPSGDAIFLQVKGVGRGATPDEVRVGLFKRWLFPPRDDALLSWEAWASLLESFLLFLGDGEDTAIAGEPPHPLIRMKALLRIRFDEAVAKVEQLQSERQETTAPQAG